MLICQGCFNILIQVSMNPGVCHCRCYDLQHLCVPSFCGCSFTVFTSSRGFIDGGWLVHTAVTPGARAHRGLSTVFYLLTDFTKCLPACPLNPPHIPPLQPQTTPTAWHLKSHIFLSQSGGDQNTTKNRGRNR